MTVHDLRQPGDFAVSRIAGIGGTAIEIMQLLDHGGYREWEHAKVYTGGGQILQAEPHGAQIVSEPLQRGDIWSTGIPALALTPEQRARVPALAQSYKSAGYSWLDYEAIFLHRVRFPDLRIWPGPQDSTGDRGRITLQEFIKDSGHLMCSQLVDNFRLRLGSHLFHDDRWEGYVKPYDLGLLLTSYGARPVP